MPRLRLLIFVVPLLSALACDDATAPTPPALQLRTPQRTLVTGSTTPQVSLGAYHTCALKTDASVVCWGDDLYGQADVPAELGPVSQVSAGGFHTCAVKTDATVVCWGSNAYGQTTIPVGLTSVRQVSAGTQHTCAVTIDRTVVCWGWNGNGQTIVPGALNSVAYVSAGVFHTCALRTDGTVVCWGEDFAGKLNVPPGLVPAVQISAGANHTCGLKVDGTVVCWGYDYYGPVDVPAGLSSVVQVSGGGRHSCALRAAGTVLCWGNNDYGQSSTFGAPASITQVGTGYLHTCALKADGTVVCWGDNSYGQSTVPLCLNLVSASDCGPPVAPVVGAINGPFFPIPVNTTIAVSTTFTDANARDTHTAVYNWGDGTFSAATVFESPGLGAASASHAYSTAGVYPITVTVIDDYGLTGQSVFEFAVIYDPAAGFVTGDGSFDSPIGAYHADPAMTGRATFAFVSRYQKGASIPTGNTQFHFQAGSLKFKATSYDWLVIAGPQAKYKGSGTINGAGDFGFLLSAVDGAVNGGGGTDRFRIKIWETGTGTIIYDNQAGASDNAPAATAISAGDILIHS